MVILLEIAVAQLLRHYYKPEDLEFDCQWHHRIFQLTRSFQPHYDPRVDSLSNRNEYQEFSCGQGADYN
jgi:hypothetical protein